MASNNCDNYQSTNHFVLTGGSNGTINNVTPSTAALCLNSAGASSQAAFSLVPTGFGVAQQVLTVSGTYTPTATLAYADIECFGAGGGGAGCPAGSSTTIAVGGAGGAGGYSRRLVSAATVGASQSYTIGAGGAAGAATSSGTGGTGGTTSMGALISSTGGVGGATSADGAALVNAGGAGGVGSTGDFNTNGDPGGSGHGIFSSSSLAFVLGGNPGVGYYGACPLQVGSGATTSSANGNSASDYAAGGGGAYSCDSGSARTGGAGGPGVIIVTEWFTT